MILQSVNEGLQKEMQSVVFTGCCIIGVRVRSRGGGGGVDGTGSIDGKEAELEANDTLMKTTFPFPFYNISIFFGWNILRMMSLPFSLSSLLFHLEQHKD
jgi:hypothetical protein